MYQNNKDSIIEKELQQVNQSYSEILQIKNILSEMEILNKRMAELLEKVFPRGTKIIYCTSSMKHNKMGEVVWTQAHNGNAYIGVLTSNKNSIRKIYAEDVQAIITRGDNEILQNKFSI